jgi:hypothetical protein
LMVWMVNIIHQNNTTTKPLNKNKMRSTLESLIEALLPYIDRSKISDQQLQDLVMEHVLMEREQILRDMIQDDEDSGLYKLK